MKFVKTTVTPQITSFRSKLYKTLIAPIDAMWEQLYIASSQHFLIEYEGGNIGYCCINEDGCLTQIFLEEEFYSKMDHVIEELIRVELIYSACLSSNEPIGFNACIQHSTSTNANTYCFKHFNRAIEINPTLNIELVANEDIPAIKVFLKEQVGMDDTFGYTENLVSRKEIYMVKESDAIIATSECRMSDSQPGIADLGIIVNKDHHGKGIGTRVMQMQVNRVLQANRKPICSTTIDNLASKKMIEKSGFYCSNIIFDIKFQEFD